MMRRPLKKSWTGRGTRIWWSLYRKSRNWLIQNLRSSALICG